MPPHKGQVRFGWRKLSKDYRKRLERKGISQRVWEDGADIRAATGHKPKPPKSAAPATVTQVAVAGELTPTQFRTLSQWEQTSRPAWLPSGLRIDVAAALSQLPDPSRWSHVQIQPQPDGGPWTMTVELKGNAYPITIAIPGGGEELSGAWQVLDLLSSPPSSKAWKDWSANDFTVERNGY